MPANAVSATQDGYGRFWWRMAGRRDFVADGGSGSEMLGLSVADGGWLWGHPPYVPAMAGSGGGWLGVGISWRWGVWIWGHPPYVPAMAGSGGGWLGVGTLWRMGRLDLGCRESVADAAGAATLIRIPRRMEDAFQQ